MSVTQVPLRPIKRGSLLKLWLALALLVVAAFALAKLGTQPFRSQTTASGIEFRTLKPGTGPLIQREDAALVDYVGTFDDGKEFDASRQPVPMGGSYKFRLPAEMGYGASPPPGKRPNAPLNFEVTVREIAAGMGPAILQQQQQQQMQGASGEAPPR